MWVFVDVDGTLVDHEDNPRPHIREFFQRLHNLGCTIMVWSAGGDDYAERKLHMIANKIQWETNIDIRPWIKGFLLKKNWSQSALILRDKQFYVDDVIELIQAQEKNGHGTFHVPFYLDPSVTQAAEKNDRWLLKAADAIEKYLNPCDCIDCEINGEPTH